MGEAVRYVAETNDGAVRIYSEDAPGYSQTIRRPDDGNLDGLLRAYGWHRVTRWAGGRAMVERTGDDMAALERYQQYGRERRSGVWETSGEGGRNL